MNKFALTASACFFVACQAIEEDPNAHWHQVNEIYWSNMSDMPYPFLMDGEISCDSYADVELALFYPYETGNDETAIGVPLTADAREIIQIADLTPNVGEVFKDSVDLDQLELEVLGICGT